VNTSWPSRVVQAVRWLIRPRPGQSLFERPVELGVAFFTFAGLLRFHTNLGDPSLPLLMRIGLHVVLVAQILLLVECIRPRRLIWPAVVLSMEALINLPFSAWAACDHCGSGQ